MSAIDVALAVTGADKANALGFCVGGTMLGCAAAVLAGRGEDKIASLTFLATMLDFSDAGEIGLLDRRCKRGRTRADDRRRRCVSRSRTRFRLLDAARK